MFNIFKKEEEKKENGHPSLISVTCLLIHSAKIDENYTDKEKKNYQKGFNWNGSKGKCDW